MQTAFYKHIRAAAALLFLVALASTGYAENIDPDADAAQYAWSENTGWLNAEPLGDGGPGVTVYADRLEGYIWAENIGWINLKPADYGGVTHNGNGSLGGYAWGENVGWINFAPTHGGVTIDVSTGLFSGWAWGENIGWISFSCDNTSSCGAVAFHVKTAWIVCTYGIDPASASIGAAGVIGNTVSVTAGAGCTWSATESLDWVTISNGASGTGNGTVTYTVDANTGVSRSGTMTIAGETYTINQAAGDCTITLSPASPQTPSNAGGTGTVTVTATHAGCTWSAVSNDTGWLHIAGGTPGPGTGSVNYTVDANTGVSRTGTMTIAGQTYTINQAAGDCTITLSPASPQTPSNAGGTGTVTVTATHAGCAWSAVSNDTGWLHISGGTPGPGTGSVDYTVDANTGVSRTGTMTIAGETYTINQAAGDCTITLSPASPRTPSNTGGTGTVTVTATHAGCTWSAESNDTGWLHITGGTPGPGTGSVNYTVDANAGVSRTGTMTIAGETYTVNQDSGIPAGNALYLRSATTPNNSVFTDESGAGHAITRYGDTKHVLFGSDTAIQYDGNSDYLKTPASPDWNFGTGDFTVDVWVNFTSTPDNFDGIFSTYKQSGVSGGYLMQVVNGTIQWYAPGATGWMNTGVTPVIGEWIHLAAVRSGNVLTIYVNGVDRAHQDCTGRSFNSSNDGLVIGKLYTLTAGYYFGGYMDEIRVTKGYALWTGNFTPPNNPEGMDTDNDGISDAQETGVYHTDSNAVDSDNDGIEDGDELNYWGTSWDTDYDGDAGTYANNLLDPDSDSDGLNDGIEVNTHGSDPSSADTDSDGLDD
ncbi:MAG: LamG-like jellyroll fold domain-containing protein, partial [Desulfosalsimonadaceae bacterium]|nr:LamG-like jellyroll fold domain-containing protein [Desulfosalsimonadaceae bacterium]